MRILVVSKLYPPVVLGGYELQCQATVTALAADHEVLVLTTDLHADETDDDRSVHRTLPCAPPYGLGLRRSIMRTLTACARVRTELRRFAPDVILLFQGSGMPHAVTAAILSTDLPVVLNIGDYWLADLYRTDPFMQELTAGSGSARGRLVRFLNRTVTRLKVRAHRPVGVLWVSEFLRGSVDLPAAIAVEREAVVRLRTPTALALEPVYDADRSPVDRQAPRLLFAGRVVPEKGIHMLIEVLGRLRSRHPGLRLRVAGSCDSDLEMELGALARHAGLAAAQLDFVGMLDPEGLRREFQDAEIFLMPSIWDEPGGMALLDAAWAGVPVVAAAAGGMPEVLHPDAHAAFFTPGDHDGLERALEEAIEDPVVTDRRRRAARAFVAGESESHRARTISFVEDHVAACS